MDLLRQAQFFSKVDEDPETGCWVWVGSRDPKGYGKFCTGRKTAAGNRLPGQAHRWSWEFFMGEVPDGLQMDHLCRNPSCVNPWHLDPVTPRVNLVRQDRMNVTQCPHGHPYDEENTGYSAKGHRFCRECGRQRCRAYNARKREMTR